MKKRGSVFQKVRKDEERMKAKEIRQYVDEKSGVVVHVFAGPEPKPYRGVPTGWSD